MMSSTLTPAESLVLLDPRGSTGIEAFKVSVMSLIAQGAIRVGEVEKAGVFRNKKIPTLDVIGNGPATPAHVASLCDIVRRARKLGKPGKMPDVAKSARDAYGKGLAGFKTNYLLPALIKRRLVKMDEDRVLWVFTRMLPNHTPAGLMEKNRIEAIIAQARRLPALLRHNPAEAAAIVLAAGGLLLLVPELKSYYGQLSALNRPMATGDGSGDGGGSGDWSSTGANGASSFDFGSFDASSLASLEMDFGSFDSSFDSSFSDGGGDSGGGDGGGGDGGGGGGD
jgi:hypothetical protein